MKKKKQTKKVDLDKHVQEEHIEANAGVFGSATKKYRTMIRKALQGQNRYTADLELPITILAGQLLMYYRALDDVAANGVVNKVITQYGEVTQINPSVNVAQKASEQLAKYLKMLGLTIKDVTIEDAGDALTSFDKSLEN